MKIIKKIYPLLGVILILSCSQSNDYQNEIIADSSRPEDKVEESVEASNASPADTAPISSSAAKTNLDGDKKFIRSADIKFKAKNVSDATYAIESLASQFSGYVTFSKLESNIIYATSTQIASDTIEDLIHYKMYNDLSIKVPNYNLDTMLKSMVPWIDFLDYRTIIANDVTLNLLASELENQRKQKLGQRLAKSIDNKGKEIKEIGKIELSLDNANKSKDEAYLRQLKLDNDVAFSTIKLHIYQDTAIRKEIHFQDDSKPYTPSLITQFKDNLAYGWDFIIQFVLFVVKYWSHYLIVIGLFYLFILVRRRIRR